MTIGRLDYKILQLARSPEFMAGSDGGFEVLTPISGEGGEISSTNQQHFPN